MKRIIIYLVALLFVGGAVYAASVIDAKRGYSAAMLELSSDNFDLEQYSLAGIAIESDDDIFGTTPYGQLIIPNRHSSRHTSIELSEESLAMIAGHKVTIIAQLYDSNNDPHEAKAIVSIPKRCDDTELEATLGEIEAPTSEVWFTPTWDQEYYEYKSPKGVKRVDIVADYNAPTDGVSDASLALQSAIDDISALGGGEVYMPLGEYRLKDIKMKSDVTLLVEAGSMIRPMYSEKNTRKTAPVSMFSFSGVDTDGKGPIENVQLIGLGGRFNVELEKRECTLGAKIFLFGTVSNFRVSNVNITDVVTTYPMFTFNPTKPGYTDKEGNDMMGAKDGIVTHARVENCHYGYGLVQIQAGENLYFEKISGVGGVTLRAETGAQGMNNAQWGGIDKIVGRYIYGKNGNAAAMISSHSMHNGDVDFRHLISDGCGIGVRVEQGYISDKFKQGIVKKPGTFQNVTLCDVIGRFGWEAQLKVKHFHYMPTQLVEFCPPLDHKISTPAPSIATVVNGLRPGPDAKSVNIENITAVGFLTPAVVTDSWKNWIVEHPEYAARWEEWYANNQK